MKNWLSAWWDNRIDDTGVLSDIARTTLYNLGAEIDEDVVSECVLAAKATDGSLDSVSDAMFSVLKQNGYGSSANPPT